MDKVCEIVKKQLALAEGTAVTGESKFSELGADSLDTVTFRSIFFFFLIFFSRQIHSICKLQDDADLRRVSVPANSF